MFSASFLFCFTDCASLGCDAHFFVYTNIFYFRGDDVEIIKYISLGVLGVYALIMLIIAILSRKPIRLLLLNAMLGAAAFLCIELTRRLSGVHIPLNEFTASSASLLGVPAVCGLLVLKVIFFA
jgi:hypothetical protein